jgi:hypothetical protein
MRHASRVLILLVVAMTACGSQMALAADGTATLGTDPRPYAVVLSSNVYKIPGTDWDWVGSNFGFAYIQNVQKNSVQTDYCATIPSAGDTRVLKAIDGVASPEVPEAIIRTLGDPFDHVVKYEGRTQDCYYLVIGTYSSSGGAGGPGGTSRWYSEFDTNNSRSSPHFVVTINDRYIEGDDVFEISSISVEMQNAENVSGQVHFILQQESLLNTQGEVIYNDSNASVSNVHSVDNDNQECVNATAVTAGLVSIKAVETDVDGVPLVTPNVKPGTARAKVRGTVAAVCGTDSLDGAEIYSGMTDAPLKWMGKGLYDKTHDKALGTGAKCVALGAVADLLNVSGHSFANATPVGVTGEAGYGLAADSFIPGDIGASWNNRSPKWVILAVCNQVVVTSQAPINAGDNGIKWITAMPGVHCLMGYRLPAPTGAMAVSISKDFCTRAATDLVHMSWMLANRPRVTICRNRNASCLVRTSNLGDKLGDGTSFAAGSAGKTYRYYWIDWERHLFSATTYSIYYYTITLP